MTHLRSLCALSLVLTTTLSSGLAFAGSSQDAAYDKRSGFVVDSWGKCVRTKWMDANDPCNPTPPPPPPAPVATPAPPPPPPVLEREERTIYFDFDSAEVDSEGQYKLNMIAELVNASQQITDVRVVGFTDQFGTDSYNQKLSERRIIAVQNYLNPRVRLDVDPQELDIRAMGKAPQDGKCAAISARDERIECMRYQRRVEIEFTYQK